MGIDPDMNTYVDIMIVAGLYLSGVLLVLFIGGLLVRTDLYRAWAKRRGKRYPRSRIIQDLRPLQQTMVEFITVTAPSHEFLQRLAVNERPIPARKLLDNVWAAESWIALFMMRVASLVRFSRRGARLTSVGREVLARMSGTTTIPWHQTLDALGCESPRQEESLPSVRAKSAKKSTSHLRLVTGSPCKNEHDRFSEPATATPSPRIDKLRTQPEASRSGDAHVGHAKSNTGTSSPAMITSADYRELTAAIVAARKLAVRRGETRVLQEKLAHAVIADDRNLPRDLITMNTRAELVDLDTSERLNLTLVFPIDANFKEGRISVFDSLGVAMLGRRVGDQFNWSVPYSVRRFEVRAIHFQPETALAIAA